MAKNSLTNKHYLPIKQNCSPSARHKPNSKKIIDILKKRKNQGI